VDADWGFDKPILSERDAANPTRDKIDAQRRPFWPMRT